MKSAHEIRPEDRKPVFCSGIFLLVSVKKKPASVPFANKEQITLEICSCVVLQIIAKPNPREMQQELSHPIETEHPTEHPIEPEHESKAETVTRKRQEEEHIALTTASAATESSN